MERTPQHTEVDPSLRLSHISQVSLDEYILSVYPEISDPEERLALATRAAALASNGDTPEQVAQMMVVRAAFDWAKTLYADTTLNEVLYLQGHTDVVDRATRIREWNEEHKGTGKEVPEIDY